MAKKSKAQIDAEQGAKETAGVVEDALRNIADKVGSIFQEALSSTDTVAKSVAKDITGSLNSLAKVSKDLASANTKAAEGAFKQADAAKLIQQRQAKIKAINYQIAMLGKGELKQKKALTDELSKVQSYNEEFEAGLQEQVDLSAKITKQMGLTGAALGGLKTIAGKLGLGSISDSLDTAKAAALNIAKTSEGLGGKFKVLGAAIGSLGKSFLKFLTDPIAIIGLLAKGIKGLVNIAGTFAKKTSDVGKAFLGMGKNAKAVKKDLVDMAANNMYLNFGEAFQAMKSLNAVTGTQVSLTEEQTNAYQKYTNLLGLSEETTQGLFKQATLSGESFDKIGASIGATIDGLNDSNSLSLDQNAIMEDVAKASASTSFNLKNNPEALAKAAFSAKRLGMTMDQITSAAESTLDFESSIQKEMEAELLLGKNLNLEQLRYAAMTGDVDTQAKEINRILSENIDATEGNVLKQDALAASMGMTREAMLEANQSRLLANKLSEQGINDRERGEKAVNALMAKGYSQEAALMKLQEEGLEYIEGQGKAAQALNRMGETFKEKFMAGLQKSGAIDKINDMIKNFAEGGGMEKISNFIAKAAGALGSFINGMINNPKATLGGLAIALGGIFLAQKMIPQMVILAGNPFKKLGKLISPSKGSKALKTASKKLSPKQIAAGFGGKAAKDQLAKQGGKMAGKTGLKVGAKLGVKAVGKSLLKKIPVIGLLAGIGFGLQRAMKGDFAGAALELASGAASTIPGLGTAASIAIDAGLAAKDYKAATGGGSTAADFISRPGQPIQKFRKDDIIVGGTSLGSGGGGNNGEVVALLKELISEVRKGGDVFMDGNKVGKSLALVTSRMG